MIKLADLGNQLLDRRASRLDGWYWATGIGCKANATKLYSGIRLYQSKENQWKTNFWNMVHFPNNMSWAVEK